MAVTRLGAKHGKNSSFLDYRPVLEGLERFVTSGALSGNPVSGLAGLSLGYLPREWHDLARNADYAVYSYGTPIAWHLPEGGWVVPEHRYSATTSAHQGKIRAALGTYMATPDAVREFLA